MTEEKTQEWQESTNGAAENTSDGWAEVSDEVKIDLESEGEGIIGTKVGMDPPNANGIIQAHFENVTDLTDTFVAERALMNAGRDLANKLRIVPNGRQVRIQWRSSLNTGQKSPMRVYSVQWR
jgi:hypothetical protein